MRAKRKQEILDTALKVFAEESYNGTSVSKIAREAGISKGLMYIYFDSKEAVLHTLLDEMIDRMLKRYELDTVKELTGEQFDEFVDVSFAMMKEDPLHMKLFFSLCMQAEVMELTMTKMMGKVMPFMQLLTVYFLRQGHKDPVVAMRYFTAALDGVMLHLIMDPDFPADPVREMIKEQFKRVR
ncbi:MAG: TetR/AcrR family transcriptional regulator [Bacteroidetes bacterium]|nr:TetR/AcrR family transcriptional regulator [Bacteroidota bacterium]